MNLPSAPQAYSQADQAALRRAIELASVRNLQLGVNLVFAAATVTFREEKCILTSPDGNRHYLLVSNGGALSTSPAP